MKRIILTLAASFAAAVFLIPATAAYAGVFGKIGSWLTGEVIAAALTAVLAIVGGVLGAMFTKIARTFREAGEFLVVLGDAVEDRSLTREELAAIIREGKDILTTFGVK